MELPPGPVYLLRLLPYFLLPSITVYAFLRLTEILFAIVFSRWITVPAIILTKPALFFLTRYYQVFRDNWNASANEAVMPPHLQGSTIFKLTTSLLTGYPGDVFGEWIEECGNIIQMLPLNVITFEPEHLKIMLATRFGSFEKGEMNYDVTNSLFGTGIFNVDGEMWKFHRSMTRPFFARERISDFEIYGRNCDRSLIEARSRLAEGYCIDFQDLVARFTLDSIAEFLFGINIESLSVGIPYPPLAASRNSSSFYEHPSSLFHQAITECQVRLAARFGMGPYWPLGNDFWKDQVSPVRRILDEFLEPLVREALVEREKHSSETDRKSKPEEATVLESLINRTQDPKIIKDEVINLLLAGRDTTMSFLTFAFYMLAEHPKIETRLRKEIFEKVGRSKSPTYDQMREMKYMRAFLNEVLRLYPPVPFNQRTSKEAVLLPNSDRTQKPYYIPAGTQCFYPVVNIHRRTDLWGPDALQFDPDRFLDSRLHNYLVPNPYIFCPFNAGPRICLGQQFAYHEATFYLVRLLQQFTGFKLDPKANLQPPEEWRDCKGRKGNEKVYVMSHLSMYIKGGLWVTMKGFSSGES